MFDPEKFGEAMGEAIRAAVAPLARRIGELEAQLAKAVDVPAEVGRAVAAAVAALPAPKDGKDCDMEAVKSFVADAAAAIPRPDVRAEVEKAVAALPKAEPGKSITVDDVRPMLDEAIRQLRKDADAAIAEPLALAEKARDKLLEELGALKQPEDGKSVTVDDVAPLIRAEVEKAVGAIPAPKDGAGVAGAMIDRDGALQITLTNGEVKSLGMVVGRDGVSFDGFELEYIADTHEIAVKASCAGRSKELRYPAGGLRPAGYWRDGTKAKAAEAWVHDGSTWFAVRDTTAKPESKSVDWIIAARKGRDGETVVKTINAGPAVPIKLKD